MTQLPATSEPVGAPSGRSHTQRFDVRQHRRVAGLFDLWLESHPDGGVAAPSDPDVPLTARNLVDIVRRSGDPADDVRLLTDDGESRGPLFGEVAGLLGRDVLVTPAGATVRHRPGPATDGDGLFDAVPVDRVTRQPVDWQVVQPPDLATSLPGWFAVDGGVVRARKGVVGLPLPDGLALATRADFVARRAAAHRLRSGFAGLATVAVAVRDGAFLVGDYRGTQEVHVGRRLAAVLGDLPLWGCDLRLWLTWPSDLAEQARMEDNVAGLAEAVGATVWAPPTGGAAELLDDGADLRAVDRTGAPARWRCWSPRAAEPSFRAEADGRLVPVASSEAVHIQAALPPAPVAVSPEHVPSSPHPALTGKPQRAVGLGVPWLHRHQYVNAEAFDVFVTSSLPPEQVAGEAIPSTELFLVGRLEPRPLEATRAATHLLRIRVEPGGALPVQSWQAHMPARFQHWLRVHDAYLLPAGRLDRLRLAGGYNVSPSGRLTATGDLSGPVLLECRDARHGVPGLPNDVPRWPDGRARRAYALLPAHGGPPPEDWLRLDRRVPAVTPGHLLVEVRVPDGRAIDVPATVAALDSLPGVRSGADRLRSAGLDLIVPSRSYDRLAARRVYEATSTGWRLLHKSTADSPLSMVLARVQPTSAAT